MANQENGIQIYIFEWETQSAARGVRVNGDEDRETERNETENAIEEKNDEKTL